jgi:Amt family ammonium transporter
VTPPAAVAIGLIAGLACYWGATALKRVLRADDSLDVFGVHGIGGIVGALLTGVFADSRISGGTGHLGVQALAIGAVALYSAIGTGLVLLVVHIVVGLRVSDETEAVGLDLGQQRERIGT